MNTAELAAQVQQELTATRTARAARVDELLTGVLREYRPFADFAALPGVRRLVPEAAYVVECHALVKHVPVTSHLAVFDVEAAAPDAALQLLLRTRLRAVAADMEAKASAVRRQERLTKKRGTEFSAARPPASGADGQTAAQ